MQREGTKNYMVDMILFPSDFYSVEKVDPDLQKEYEATLDTGLYNVVLFGYDQWFQEERLVLSEIQVGQARRVVQEALGTEAQGMPTKGLHRAVYRGWMMKPEQYERFYEELRRNGIELVDKPEEYMLMHVFPNVYPAVREDTARMEIFPLHERIDVEQLKKNFPRFMVKDFVKSVKGTDFPKYFDRTVTQEVFDEWMEVFYKYRGGLLTGGICIKEFLDLKHYGERTNEYRVFYINHIPATISANSEQPNFAARVPQELVDKYRNLDSVYYTVDFAELEDGSWRIVEAGDGSVSGLSEGQDYGQYFRAMYQCFQ